MSLIQLGAMQERPILTLRRGEQIKVTTKLDDAWWGGCIIGKAQGIFPKNFTKIVGESE